MLCDARDHASPSQHASATRVKRYKGTCAVEHIILALRSLRSRCAAGSGWLHTSRLAHEQRQQRPQQSAEEEEEAVPAQARCDSTAARRTVAHTTAGAVAVHTVPTRRRREPLPCWTTGGRRHYHAIWGRRRPHVQLCPADRLLPRARGGTTQGPARALRLRRACPAMDQASPLLADG